MATDGGLMIDTGHLEYFSKQVASDIAAGHYDGGRFIAAIGGEIVLDLTAGYFHHDSNKPMEKDAVFSVMSLTKIMTTIGIMRLVERGRLQLTTRVADILPAFAQNGKDKSTSAQLLTQTAGLGNIPLPLSVAEMGNLAAATEAVCSLPLESVPGEHVNYSGQSAFTILGAIVAQMDEAHRSYRDVLLQDIFTPLGMRDTAVGMPDRLRPRMVPLVVRAKGAPELNTTAIAAREKATTDATELPSGGVYATATDMFRFAEMLRQGGQLAGRTIISPATLALMRRNQTGSKPNSLMSAMRTRLGFPDFPAFLGLGMFLRGEGLFPSLFGSLASPDTFGGFGLGSTTLWVDPDSGITFVALTAGLMERVGSLLRFQRLSDIVHGAVRIRS